MFRVGILTLVGIVMGSTSGWAQESLRMRFEKGQVLTYEIVQATQTTETVPEEKTGKLIEQQHLTKHTVVRTWTVTDVDGKGIATLEMRIASIRWEQKLPNGEYDIFDSSKPDEANKNEMAKLIGPVQAEIRVDGQGQVVEVKKGNAGRFAVDLPFKIILPVSGPTPGQHWNRSFQIKLDPPHGTGEVYKATQQYTAKAPMSGYHVVSVSTTIADMPMEAADQIPLLPMIVEGDVYIHPKTGLYSAARFQLKRDLKNHAGEGTKYTYVSTYSEDLKVMK